MLPTMVASSPMFRWQKPPILAAWYISAVFSSKRRIRSISRYRSRRMALSPSESFALLSVGRCSTFISGSWISWHGPVQKLLLLYPSMFSMDPGGDDKGTPLDAAQWLASWDRQQERLLPDREERFRTMFDLVEAVVGPPAAI